VGSWGLSVVLALPLLWLGSPRHQPEQPKIERYDSGLAWPIDWTSVNVSPHAMYLRINSWVRCTVHAKADRPNQSLEIAKARMRGARAELLAMQR
jgi:hypothetical protein